MVRPIPKTLLLTSIVWFTHAVYYRLYTKLGAFESNHALYSNDRFIGRIPSRSFAPPHTVASIKLSLCGLEGLSEPDKALLFTPLWSPVPKEDPPLFVRSFWPRPVRTRSDRVGGRVGEED